VTYRKAVLKDLELLSETRVEFITTRYKDMADQKKSELYANTKAYFTKTLEDGSFVAFLAFEGDRLAATSGVNFYQNPPNASNISGITAYVSNMYTKPEFRGRGIATRLLSLVTAEARERGCGKATLVATEMGRPIYQKFGFTAADNVMDYYFNN
jgi:GNAT superfamily N-acetyltransferase